MLSRFPSLTLSLDSVSWQRLRLDVPGRKLRSMVRINGLFHLITYKWDITHLEMEFKDGI